MYFVKKYFFVLPAVFLFPMLASASVLDSTWIRFDGTLKTKFEWATGLGDVRFNLRNSRAGFRGGIGKYVDYRVQVELSSEGKFVVLDGYATLKPTDNFCASIGQTAVPFYNLYLITPSEMMFANMDLMNAIFSPFARDLGVTATYKIGKEFPITIDGGVFNGSTINNPTWTDNPSYAFRVTAGSLSRFKASAKVFRYPKTDWLLYGADISYRKGNWLLQAEMSNRYNYNDTISSAIRNFTGIYVQSSYTIPCDFAKIFHGLIPAVRWDAVSYDMFNNGIDVNRITAGLAFALTSKPFSSLIRIDYEHYFLRNELPELRVNEHALADKLSLELLLKF